MFLEHYRTAAIRQCARQVPDRQSVTIPVSGRSSSTVVLQDRGVIFVTSFVRSSFAILFKNRSNERKKTPQLSPLCGAVGAEAAATHYPSM